MEEPQTETQEFEEEQQEEVYIPGLSNSALFQRLPPLTGFQRLVSKDIIKQIQHEQVCQSNPQSSNEEYSSTSPDELIKTCSWRALAELCRQKIINSDPSTTNSILQLWSYRFRALYKLRLPTIILREMIGLFQTISCTFPLTEILLNLSEDTLPNPNKSIEKKEEDYIQKPSKKSIPDIIPFSILILRARLPTLLRPHQQESVIKTSDGLLELLEGSRRMVAYYQHTKNSPKEVLWRSRIRELIGLLISLFSGHGFQSDSITEQVRVPTRGPIRPFIPDRELSIELIHELMLEGSKDSKEINELKWIEEEIKLRIEMGDFDKADQLLEQLHRKTYQPPSFSPSQLPLHPLSLVRLIAAGQLDQAIDLVRSSLSSSSFHANNHLETHSDLSLINNFCIALLYCGKLNQAFPVLKKLIEKIGSIGSGKNEEKINDTGDDQKEDEHGGRENTKRFKESSTCSLNEKNLLKENEMLNSLIFNYSTFIELNFGIDCDQIKRDLFNHIIKNFSKLDQTPISDSNDKNQNIPLQLHRFLDLISLNSFKFPASYFDL